MSVPHYVVFEVAGEQLALSAVVVDRVVRHPTLVRLPSVGMPAGQGVGWGMHLGDEIVPLLDRAASELSLVLRSGGGRIAVGVDRVLGVGALEAGDRWAGRAVRPVTVAEFERVLGKVAPPIPLRGRSVAEPADPVAPAARRSRVLHIRAGGAEWMVEPADVVAVHEPMPLVRVPLAPPGLLGAAMLDGRAVPVMSMAGQDGGHAALVFVRDASGPMGIALDSVPVWSVGRDAPRLDFACLRVATGLAPAPALPPAATNPARPQRSLLPVIIAGRRFGLPLPLVEKIVPRTALARLPASGGPASAPSAAVAVDGRAVPMTDGARWMGLEHGGPPAIHVLIRPNQELHVLAVDAVDRPVTLDSSRVQPVRDPAGRLAGLAHLADELLPVLDLGRIGAAA